MEQAGSFPVFEIDGVLFRMRSFADLTWLKNYGTVFCVMDALPSGNLCFGVEGPYGRLFVKYAGAQTINCAGKPEDAVSWLRYGAELYHRFYHDRLIPLLADGPVPGGYAAVFPWQDAPPLRPMPPNDRTRARLRRLPLVQRLDMLDGIFDLHALLSDGGLIAVDFTDEHVLIDFARKKALVCDIDQFRRRPAVNTRGRMPGSPRFLAPEEYIMGEELREDTTVYKLGALAFEVFGDNADRSVKSWVGPPALYPVAERATRDKRGRRYAAVREFLTDWRQAVSETSL